MVLIKLKWNKITYDDVQINVEDGALAFKKKVYELTRVPIDRQKLMAKGAWVGILKDDTDLTKVKLTEASQVLLMGSAEVIAEPTETVKFFEDMSSQERAETGVTVPSGLVNLGNTCYMNSTIQCLRRIPELRGPPLNSGDMNSEFSRSFQNTMSLLDSSEASIPPYEFVSKLRNFFPQFAERGQSGNYMQQDAEEFFNVLANSLAMGMPNGNGNIDQLMGLRLEEKLVCEEAPDSEPPVINHVSINKIICNIQGDGHPYAVINYH
jgi:ubiquitin carboxyl-terminal hydrolase 14